MTLTTAVLKDVLIKTKLPHIRIAVPSMRYASKSARSATNATRQNDLEQLFREDFAHLSKTRQRPMIDPKAGRFACFAARDMSRASRQVD